MKLKVMQHGGTFSLEESDAAAFGLAFVCIDGNPSRDRRRQAQSLTEGVEAEIMLADGCRHPSCPDAWAVAAAYCRRDDTIKILEYEPVEYPEGAIF